MFSCSNIGSTSDTDLGSGSEMHTSALNWTERRQCRHGWNRDGSMARVCKHLCDELPYRMAASTEEKHTSVFAQVCNAPSCNEGRIFAAITLRLMSIFRSVRSAEGVQGTASWTRRNLGIRIGLPSYKIVYEYGTEDFEWGRMTTEERVVLEERARARAEERKRSRWLCG